MSRVAILRWLADVGMQLARDLPKDLAHAFRFVCIARWVRIAVALVFHIDNGALDEPRPPRRVRVRAAANDDEASAQDHQAPERPEREPLTERERDREHEEVQRLLDRPFGEVVALICKGLGVTPDWHAWAADPWAQEEIRTPPEGSPYEGWPSRSRALEPPPRPRPSSPPDTPRLAAPPGHAPPPDGPTLRDQILAARVRAARRRAFS